MIPSSSTTSLPSQSLLHRVLQPPMLQSHHSWPDNYPICKNLQLGLNTKVQINLWSWNKAHISTLLQATAWKSALQNYSKACMVGPPPPPEHGLDVITSWIAVLPKKTTGKFRVIVDLSSSLGHSVKDAIHCEFKLVGYSSIDDVALLMHSLCRAAPWPRLTSRTRIQNGDTPLVGSQWYSSGWLHYFQFAKLVNLPPIPVTAEKTTLFVAFMGISGISCVNNRV